MPRTSHVGISLRIEDEAERERLKQVVAECVAAEGIREAGGFILRTAAEGAGRDEILMDIRYLRRLWEQIAGQIKTAAAPTVIYEDLSLAMRTLRDWSIRGSRRSASTRGRTSRRSASSSAN